MISPPLKELADEVGILCTWSDAHGRPVHLEEQVLRGVLQALDLPTGDPGQITASLDTARRRRRAASQGPLIIADAGHPVDLKERLPPGSDCVLLRDDGARLELKLDELGQLPAQPAGYHHLSCGDRHWQLACAPPTCPSVQALTGERHVWGIAAQVYSLRRPGDGGLGDTSALQQLAIHAAAQGADALAISPLHAMFSNRPEQYSPYSPSSRSHYNILHADPAQILGPDIVAQAMHDCQLTETARQLEQQPLIDWPAVARLRLRLLRHLHRQLPGLPSLLQEDFQRFCQAAGQSLQQHCCHEALQHTLFEQGYSSDWRQWPPAWRNPDSLEVRQFAEQHATELQFHAFGQWLITRCLEQVQQAARKGGMGIGLIADLAIGADPSGSFGWACQHQLLAGLSVGAPPDLLSRDGQNWGVTAFSPWGLKQQGYAAFIAMLRANLANSGGLRIDHIMGLQRLWLIPEGADPAQGAYLRFALDDLLRLLSLEAWRHQALIIGEDLGTVPDGLRHTLAQRQILGMQVLQFEQQDGSLPAPGHWSDQALATTGTHDLPTTLGWLSGRDIDWREQTGQTRAEQTQQAHQQRRTETHTLDTALREQGLLPPGNDRADQHDQDDHCHQQRLTACIRFIGRTPAPLVLLPLEDIMASAEQPNLPGPDGPHPNWRRRWTQPAAQMLNHPLPRQRLHALDEARRRPTGRATMTELRATLRLQLHPGFTLDDAAEQVDYFARLGISHLYTSPLLQARPGSTHGYDVIDPTCIDPELGGEPALRRLAEALHQRQMGLIMDLVPNHMAADCHNPWWQDVLLWGSNSKYAQHFDIDWRCHDPALRNKVLLPILAQDYLSCLKAGEIRLTFVPLTGHFYLCYAQQSLPVALPSYAQILQGSQDSNLIRVADRCAALEDEFAPQRISASIHTELAALARGDSAQAIDSAVAYFNSQARQHHLALHALLENQHYRLASWRTANDEINWRRFFDVNELVALRAELPQVFEDSHRKVFELIEAGLIDGLRIDHVDGLANPHSYCRRLRRRVRGLRPQDHQHFTLHVEKILAENEQLPGDWQVDGTTGYEFMNRIALIQHDPNGHAPLSELWRAMTGRTGDFKAEARAARREVLEGSLAADVEAVVQGLSRLARGNLATRDLTTGAIRRSLRALISHYPAYRTYSWVCGHSAQDQQLFEHAMTGARKALRNHDWPVLEQLQRWLGGDPLQASAPGSRRHDQRRLLARFHQLTAPVAAKAQEDTAFYRSGVLLSRNEVGSDPYRFSADHSWFHEQCRVQAERFPLGLLATASHDHKRGEDARARLAVASEHAPWLGIQARFWHKLAEPLRSVVAGQPAPGPADELMLYQTLFAHWPLGLDADHLQDCQTFAERVQQWQYKALREAKLRSSWAAPDHAYEQACSDFLQRLLTARDGMELRRALAHAARLAAPNGALNSLGQCLLRMTCPGVPDLYQGCEYWDFSLVDPDNRRPVDFAQRQHSLNQHSDPAELLQHWHDGRVKQWLIARTLDARRQQPALFRDGDYQPLRMHGAHAQRLIAFSRRHGDQVAISLVPNLAAPLLRDSDRPLIPPNNWDDTLIDLPETPLISALTGAAVNSGAAVPVSELLADVPVNLLVSMHPQENTP